MPAWMRAYDRAWVRPDTVAGLTVLAYVVPQVLAYSAIIGLPPRAGLVTAVIALAVYPWIGSSRALSLGPEATISLMAGSILAPLVARDPARVVPLTATLTVLVALWFAVGRLVHAGVVAHLLTRPILTGYLTGEAVLMVASQLGAATRTSSSGGTVIAQLIDFTHGLGRIHLPTLAVTAGTLALLVLLPRIDRRIPTALTAVAVATVTAALIGAAGRGVRELGHIPRGAQPISLPMLDSATIGTLLVGSLGIALLAFSDIMLVARGFATPGEEVDPDREMLAASVVHLVAGLLGGYPSSASSSRSAIGTGAGQRSQASGLVTALGLVLVLAFAGPLLAHLPVASLAAIVFWAAWKLVSLPDFRRLWQFRRSEFAIAATTAVGTALIGLLPGIGLAVALSAVQILVTLAHPHEAVEGYVVGRVGLHDIDDYPNHVTIPGLLIYRYDGPLIAYNRDDFHARLMRAVGEHQPRWVLLNVEATMLVDFSACETLRAVIASLQADGRTVALARLKVDLRVQLEAAGVMALLGEHAYETLPQAIAVFHAANPDLPLPPIPPPGRPFDPAGPSHLPPPSTP